MIDSLELSAFLISVIAGILIGIPTGPARFFVVDTCLNDGKKAALKVYGGLFSAVVLYASLAMLASDFISRHERVETYFYLLAAILLIVWGVVIMVKSNKQNDSSIELNVGSWFGKGFVVGISNPVTPFIYLTLIQLIKAYSVKNTFLSNVMFLLIFEIFSFLTISFIIFLLLNKKEQVMNRWNIVKLVMGLFLVCLGTYQTLQQVEFEDGIKVKSSKSFLEKQMSKEETNN